MQPHFYTTLLLAFTIQLDYVILSTDAEENLQEPDISVDGFDQNSGGVNIACLTNLKHVPPGTNISCNLYIGDSSKPFRRTWTNTTKVCIFTVNISDLQKSRAVSCDYSVNIEPHSPRSVKKSIVGKLPQSVLELSPAVISLKASVKLRCSRPDYSPASHCTFTFNQRRLSGSDCERSVTGAELLSGSHSALNSITLRCVHSPEGGEKPPIESDPSTVTVLDLMKPSISVSTDLTNTHIRCEAPPGIIGAYFILYLGKKGDNSRGTQAKEQRAVNFTVPHSSDSNLTYCCRYQIKTFNSDLSDCVHTKNKDQSGSSTDKRPTTDNSQIGCLKTPACIAVILTVSVICLGMMGACVFWIRKKRKSNRLPTAPKNDAVYATVDMTKGPETSNTTVQNHSKMESPAEVTYSTVTHLASQNPALHLQKDNVVYSTLKTD